MKCANPLCNREERYFRSGTLHSIDCDPPEYVADGDVARQKVIWLCERCSRNFRVDTWRPPGEQLHARSPKHEQDEDPMKEVTTSAA